MQPPYWMTHWMECSGQTHDLIPLYQNFGFDGFLSVMGQNRGFHGCWVNFWTKIFIFHFRLSWSFFRRTDALNMVTELIFRIIVKILKESRFAQMPFFGTHCPKYLSWWPIRYTNMDFKFHQILWSPSWWAFTTSWTQS